jgi:carbonic anhydrase
MERVLEENPAMLKRLLPIFAVSGLLFGGCNTPDSGQYQSKSDVRVMTRESQTAMSPPDALQQLKDGNERFVAGRSLHRDLPEEVQASAGGQFPFAAVVTCLDSRTSAELVFDQGLGAIFCARVAGNVIDEDILGSLEFATKVAGAKLILVVGHSSCGAVKGACDKVELGHLTALLSKIEPAVQATKPTGGGAANGQNAAFVDDVARENVRRMVKLLPEQSPILKDLVASGSLKIVGGFQDLRSGRVTLLD